MSSHTHLDSHTLSLMDSVLSSKPSSWSPIPRWLQSDEVRLVPALWHISLTQWQLRWMEHKEMKEMKERKSAGREEVREEVRAFRTERRGYGNTGGVNGRWGVNPYEYRRMRGEALVISGGQLRPREASTVLSETSPSHDFHVHNRMEGESLVATTPSHDFHVPVHHRMEIESLVAPGGQLHLREASMVSGDATPSHDFHAPGLSHRMERESLVAPGEQIHPREASMVARNTTPPANDNAPPQDFQAFLMGVEGTPFLNSMEEAGRFAQQRRR